MPFCLVDESEEDVSDRLANVRAVVHELSIDAVQYRLQVVSLPWVLAGRMFCKREEKKKERKNRTKSKK